MKYLLSLCFLIISFASSTAFAKNCAFVDGTAKQHLTITIPSQFSFPKDMPIGSIIYETDWHYVNQTKVLCAQSGTVHGNYSGDIKEPIGAIPGFAANQIYKTGVPGVGIQLFWCNTYTYKCRNWDSDKSLTPPPLLVINHSSDGYYYPWHNWVVRLIKIGDFNNNHSQSFNINSSMFYSDLEVASVNVMTSGQLLNVSSRSCKVTTPSEFTVRLPEVNKSDFKAIGALNDKTANFSIDMMCERDLKVNYMFTSLNQNSELENVISNATGNNMATGVGIQLFKGGAESNSVVNLNQKYQHTTTGATNNNYVSIPFTAKYYKLKDSMTGGLVNTKAVFTLTYE